MRISVYVTSYNQKSFLIEAIESVLKQTLRPYEIIIVDDCSSDRSQEVIAGYASRYPRLITPIYHTCNQGVAQTRIDALKAVTGDYVTYVDGDDRFLPNKLESEARMLQENPNAKIAFSNHYYMTVDGIRTGVWADRERPPQGDVFRQVFARDFPRSTLFHNELVPYSCLREVGFHDDGLVIYEDWDLRIRLTKHFKVVYCPKPLTEVRVHSSGLSSLPASLHLRSARRVFEKNRPLLDDLPKADRVMIEKRLSSKFARLARRAAWEEIERSNKRLAFRYWLQALQYGPGHPDFRLVTQLMLPRWAYLRLRAVHRRVRDKRR